MWPAGPLAHARQPPQRGCGQMGEHEIAAEVSGHGDRSRAMLSPGVERGPYRRIHECAPMQLDQLATMVARVHRLAGVRRQVLPKDDRFVGEFMHPSIVDAALRAPMLNRSTRAGCGLWRTRARSCLRSQFELPRRGRTASHSRGSAPLRVHDMHRARCVGDAAGERRVHRECASELVDGEPVLDRERDGRDQL